jgi:uncharacterized protein involved in exopolysaccharide biosynthesis
VQSRGKRWSVVAAVAMIFVSSAAAATAKPSPKAVFSASVRAIGTQAQHALLALPPVTASSTSADAAATAGQLQAIYQRVARRMGALTVPKAIAADFKILRASYQVAAGNAGAWRDAILHGTAKQAADAASKLYLNTESVRAGNAMARMSVKGYYFGTFFH